MVQPRKTKRKPTIPKNLIERDDHEIMECVFGKRVMRKIDEVVESLKKEETDVMPK